MHDAKATMSARVLPFKTLIEVPAANANVFLHLVGDRMQDGPAPGSPHGGRQPAKAHRVTDARVLRVGRGSIPGTITAWLEVSYDEVFA